MHHGPANLHVCRLLLFFSSSQQQLIRITQYRDNSIAFRRSFREVRMFTIVHRALFNPIIAHSRYFVSTVSPIKMPTKTALALLAEGAEEMELVITVDVLRRAGVS